MKQKFLYCLKKIWNYYQAVVVLINNSFKEDLTKTVICLLLFLVFFLFFKNSLTALLLGSTLAVVFFRWDSRIFFGVALLFLVSCPIFLFLKDETWAEQMAIYAYYLLVVGVIIQIIDYAKEQSEVEGIKKTASLVSQSTLILLLIVMAVGFFYFNNKFTTQLATQDDLINRIGGFKVKEEDKEITKMKQQMQEVLDLLSTAANEKVSNIGAVPVLQIPASNSITVDILNGTFVKGAAAALKEQLLAKGYFVSSIGNEPKNYVETVIKFNPGFGEQALILQQELQNKYTVKIEEVSNLKNNILIIIGQEKND